MKCLLRVLCVFALFAGAASVRAEGPDGLDYLKPPKKPYVPGRFTFVRIEYDSEGGYGEAYYDYDGRRWLRWQTDSPHAEENLLYRMKEFTTIDLDPRVQVRRLTDPDLFDFPLIYMSDPGWGVYTDEEVRALRSYLNRGGMLWVDDFWGHAEWENLEQLMKRVMPDAPWREIPKDHEILKIVFPLKEIPQIPAQDFALSDWKWDPPWIHKAPTTGPGDTQSDGVEQAHLRGWFDRKGRLVCVATHNTDLGDGWEREGENQWYFDTYSRLAYAMGINIVIYALTH